MRSVEEEVDPIKTVREVVDYGGGDVRRRGRKSYLSFGASSSPSPDIIEARDGDGDGDGPIALLPLPNLMLVRPL
jgi:hypothetical protein